MCVDFHSGADVPDWINTFAGFDLRASEHSEDSRTWQASGHSESTRTRFGFVLLVLAKMYDYFVNCIRTNYQ